MANKNENDLEGQKIDATTDLNKKIDAIKKETIDPNIKQVVSEMNQDTNVDTVVSDLFYKSVKLIFDTGFDLAKKLNLDLFESFKFDDKKKEKKEEP
jgi:hypothetical protein